MESHGKDVGFPPMPKSLRGVAGPDYHTSLTGFQSAVKATGVLDAALAKSQLEFKPVNKSKTAKVRGEKNGKSYEYSYKYADYADILSMALPLLTKNGISFSQPLRRRDGKLFVVTRLACGSEVSEDDGIEIPQNVRPQELGTYLQYYRRYGASTNLGISTEEDIDGPSDGGEVKETSSSGQAKTTTAKITNTPVITKPIPLPTTPPLTQEVAGFAASESDIPSNIGSAPDKTAMAKIKADLKNLAVDMDKLKAYSLKVTGKAETKFITTQEWNDLIKSLTDAKQSGTLEKLIS